MRFHGHMFHRGINAAKEIRFLERKIWYDRHDIEPHHKARLLNIIAIYSDIVIEAIKFYEDDSHDETPEIAKLHILHIKEELFGKTEETEETKEPDIVLDSTTAIEQNGIKSTIGASEVVGGFLQELIERYK